MSKKKKMTVAVITAKQQFDQEKERYNPYQTGHGVWRDKRFPNRKTEKDRFRKELANGEYL